MSEYKLSYTGKKVNELLQAVDEKQSTWDSISQTLPIPVDKGGTGANSALQAIRNLGGINFHGGELIPNNSDLDDYTTVGNYVCATGVNAKTLKNRPSGIIYDSAFGLIVDRIQKVVEGTTLSLLSQTFYTRTNGDIPISFSRLYKTNLSGWSDWGCSSGIDNIIAEGTSGNWQYIKMANGLAICWYIDLNLAISSSNKDNIFSTSVLRKNGYITPPFSLLTNKSNVLCLLSHGARVGLDGNVTYDSSRGQCYYDVSLLNTEATSFELRLLLIGRWK